MNENCKDITVSDNLLRQSFGKNEGESPTNFGNDIIKRIKGRMEYKDTFPRVMYTFFTSYSESGAPSFSKFARSIGATLSDVNEWRKISEFDRAYRECSEIRRDYLIDCALGKRYDPSFTKYLLSYEYGMDESGVCDSKIEVTLEVIE